MHRFKNILVVIDDKPESKTVLERAVALGKRNQARLALVTVIEEMPREAHKLFPSKSLAELQEQITEERGHHLEQLAVPIRHKGVQVSTKVLSGTPFLEIIREVLRNRHDLVMIPAEGADGLKEMLFGSTPMHLMRKCPCPVWVIPVWVMKSSRPKRYRRMLAAVDPTPLNEERNALNTKIMELATSLARLEKSRL